MPARNRKGLKVVKTYAEAADYLGNRKSRSLGLNTQLVRENDSAIAVRLYSTDIVVMHDNGDYTLSSGSWRTVTTAHRISAFAPVTIWSESGQWYFCPGQTYSAGKVEFEDGIRVDSCGNLLPHFEVVVGNVGTVYSGHDRQEAESTYTRYCELSKSGQGRSANEEITFMSNCLGCGGIEKSYVPLPYDMPYGV